MLNVVALSTKNYVCNCLRRSSRTNVSSSSLPFNFANMVYQLTSLSKQLPSPKPSLHSSRWPWPSLGPFQSATTPPPSLPSFPSPLTFFREIKLFDSNVARWSSLVRMCECVCGVSVGWGWGEGQAGAPGKWVSPRPGSVRKWLPDFGSKVLCWRDSPRFMPCQALPGRVYGSLCLGACVRVCVCACVCVCVCACV